MANTFVIHACMMDMIQFAIVSTLLHFYLSKLLYWSKLSFNHFVTLSLFISFISVFSRFSLYRPHRLLLPSLLSLLFKDLPLSWSFQYPANQADLTSHSAIVPPTLPHTVLVQACTLTKSAVPMTKAVAAMCPTSPNQRAVR